MRQARVGRERKGKRERGEVVVGGCLQGLGEEQVAGGEWDGGLGVERCESREWLCAGSQAGRASRREQMKAPPPGGGGGAALRSPPL